MNKINILFSELNLTEAKVHGFGFSEDDFELYLDIDYVKAVVENSVNINYELVSSTLVFKNVCDLIIDLSHYNLNILIDDILRLNPTKPKNHKYVSGLQYDWTIETINGSISFKSIGLDIYIRSSAPYSNKSELTLTERGGISFSKEGELFSVTD